MNKEFGLMLRCRACNHLLADNELYRVEDYDQLCTECFEAGQDEDWIVDFDVEGPSPPRLTKK